jgi:hypothetical protein
MTEGLGGLRKSLRNKKTQVRCFYMHEKDSQYTAEFHELYINAKKLVDEDIAEWGGKMNDINDPQERDFYLSVVTHFLQKRQQDVINKGIF